jgi:ankyrin repeat protein
MISHRIAHRRSSVDLIDLESDGRPIACPRGARVAIVDRDRMLAIEAGGGSVWASNDRGRGWSRVSAAPFSAGSSPSPRAPLVGALSGGVVLVVDRCVAFQSSDMGRTWVEVCADIGVDASIHSDAALVCAGGVAFLFLSRSVWRSMDGGGTWRVACEGGPCWSGMRIAATEDAKSVLAFAPDRRTWRSVDMGETWHPSATRAAPGVCAVGVDPGGAHVLALGSTDASLWCSGDGGASWCQLPCSPEQWAAAHGGSLALPPPPPDLVAGRAPCGVSPARLACMNGHDHLIATAAEDELRDMMQDAVGAGCVRTVARLIDSRSADPSAIWKNGDSAIFYAIRSDNVDMFNLLVSKGADATRRDRYGQTALHVAAIEGCSFIADVHAAMPPGAADERDEGGRTALHCACSLGRTEVAQTLLSVGSDPSATDALRRTPLHHASMRDGGDRIVDLLIRAGGADLDATTAKGHTALACACAGAGGGRMQTIRQLLRAGASVDIAPSPDKTPILIAAKTKNHAAVLELAEFGADIESVADMYGTDLDMTTKLIAAGESRRAAMFDFKNGAKCMPRIINCRSTDSEFARAAILRAFRSKTSHAASVSRNFVVIEKSWRSMKPSCDPQSHAHRPRLLWPAWRRDIQLAAISSSNRDLANDILAWARGAGELSLWTDLQAAFAEREAPPRSERDGHMDITTEEHQFASLFSLISDHMRQEDDRMRALASHK